MTVPNFEPLSPSTLMRQVNLRIDSILNLFKLIGPAYVTLTVKDEIILLHDLVLDHTLHDPELYLDSARSLLRLREHHTIPGQSTWKAK